jgi:PKHD-type hydroxylase
MAQSVSFSFNLPDPMMDSIIHTLSQSPKLKELKQSSISVDRAINTNIRNSQSVFMSNGDWFVGMLYYYADLINKRIYQFDITGYDGDSIQYAEYHPGDFYSWHSDDINKLPSSRDYTPRSNIPQPPEPTEYVRKLSFSLQLNDDYTGGELQLYQPCLGKPSLETVHPQKGLLTIFDSRTLHRVRKVKSGTRKSIVGWLVGPRWK